MSRGAENGECRTHPVIPALSLLDKPKCLEGLGP